jgi:monoamine oxidase
VGGRTKSVWLPNGPWINYGAQYITDDRPQVVALADAVGVELLPYKGFGDYLKQLLPSNPTELAEVEATIQRIEAEQTYNIDHFMGRTPGDFDEVGGCFHSFMANAAACQVWDDADESIKSGAVRALLARFPEYGERIGRVEIQRWAYGVPQYRRGLMKHFPALAEPVGGIHFAGDYMWQANMEGAVRSGQRAATQVRVTMNTGA